MFNNFNYSTHCDAKELSFDKKSLERILLLLQMSQLSSQIKRDIDEYIRLKTKFDNQEYQANMLAHTLATREDI